MNSFSDAFSLLFECIGYFFSEARSGFYITIAVAIVLAVACWWACSHFSKLYNRHYSANPLHHTLCGIAAFITIFAVVAFAALKYTKEVAENSIERWSKSIVQNQAWADATLAKTYDAVFALRDGSGNQLEDFTGKKHPREGGLFVPTSSKEAQLAAAETYAKEALREFKKQRPFLSKILWGDSDLSEEVIFKDVEAFFAQRTGKPYPAEKAVMLAVRETENTLAEQTPRVIPLSRTVLAALFVLIQAIPFALIGKAAYDDIRERRSAQAFGR